MAKAPRTLADMAAESNSRQGLQCPKCGCCNFATYRTQQQIATVVRYKSCRNCGHRILTSTQSVERIVRDVDARDSDDDGDAEVLSLVI